MESYKRLLRYSKPYMGRIVLAMICSALVGACTGLTAMIVKTVVDEIFMNRDQVMLFYIPFIVIALVGSKGLFSFGHVYLIEYVGQRVVLQLRRELYEHLHALSLRFFARHQTGLIVSRITNDVNQLQVAAASILADAIKQGGTAVALLAVVFYRHWKLALISLLVLPVAMGIVTYFGRRMRRISRTMQIKMADMNNVLYEKIAGIRIVKAFCAEHAEIERFVGVLNEYFTSALHAVQVRAITSSLSEVLGGIGVAGVIWYGGYEVIHGITTPGTFFSFMTALLLLYEPLKRLSSYNIKLQQAMAATDRVFEVLDTQPDLQESPQAVELLPIKDSITYQHVSFRYDDELVLHDISFTEEVGKVIAFVGLSGAGKTTLLSLLPRFYDPESGAILIDGADIRDVTLRSLRRQIGIVTQEIVLFNETVADNIRYGMETCSDEEVVQAARVANADEFIRQLPQGYDTVIGERGTRLSGGQRQRIAIARAILKNPPIIILDEATSSLDSESERFVQEAIANLMRDRTTLVIAHRLSTIKKADRIIVLDQGRIVETGTHQELLRNDGIYSRLYEMQFLGDTDAPE
jgi:ATP-binding cassette, subfamily B, bacterial MsbA